MAARPLGLIESTAQIEQLAGSVPDNGGVYFVPAFSGLFAPHWREDARGVIVGLTAYANRGHIARAALEATAWQTREVVDECAAATGAPFAELRVDGGMTANELLMQFQADVLGVDVVRPVVSETTAWARPSRRDSRSASGPMRASCASAGASSGAGARRWIRGCASASTRAGAARSRAPSTGSSRKPS